jgi:hypothetical protein
MKTKPLAKKSARHRSVAPSSARVIKRTPTTRSKAASKPLPNDFLATLEALQKPFRARGELVTASREESDLLARMIAGEAA